MTFHRCLLACLMALSAGVATAGAGQQPFADSHAFPSGDPADQQSCAAGTESPAFVAATPDANTYAVYRVSQANAEEVRAALPGIALRSGEDSVTYRYFDLIAGQMAAVLANGGGVLDDRNALHQVLGLAAEAMATEQEPLFVDRVRFMRGAECSRTCLQASDLLLCDVARAGTPARRQA